MSGNCLNWLRFVPFWSAFKTRQSGLYRHRDVPRSLQMLVGNIICICPSPRVLPFSAHRPVLLHFLSLRSINLLCLSVLRPGQKLCLVRCNSLVAREIRHGWFLGGSLIQSFATCLKNVAPSRDITDFQFDVYSPSFEINSVEWKQPWSVTRRNAKRQTDLAFLHFRPL